MEPVSDGDPLTHTPSRVVRSPGAAFGPYIRSTADAGVAPIE
jgi:hypothetical protein